MDKQRDCDGYKAGRCDADGRVIACGCAPPDKEWRVARTLIWFFGLILLLSGQIHAREPLAATVEVLAKSSSSWNGDVLPEYADGRPEVTILRIAIPPGVRLPLHMHPVINAGVMTKGELTVTTEEGQVLHLRAGDPIVEVVDVWHYGKNEGEEAAEIIVFYAGIQGKPITVKATGEK